MKALLLFTLLLASTFAYTINQIVTDDDKVKIDFYYESLCPYCQQFIQKSLKAASETKVSFFLSFRISGKYVISTFIPMVTQEEFKMDLNGHLHANMEKDNVKEM